jgi:hypothetical protein
VDIAGNVVSDTGGTSPPTDHFVKDHLLAVMSKANMKLAAGFDMMGAFYALGNIASGINTTVVGAMMSNSFNMPDGGAGSASIYHVKGIADELARMGMIRSEMVFTFKTYTWEEKWQ